MQRTRTGKLQNAQEKKGTGLAGYAAHGKGGVGAVDCRA